MGAGFNPALNPPVPSTSALAGFLWPHRGPGALGLGKALVGVSSWAPKGHRFPSGSGSYPGGGSVLSRGTYGR